MGIAPSLSQLRALSDDEVIEHYDTQAGRTDVGVNFWLDEYSRRVNERQVRVMLGLTWAIAAMTVIVTITTIANLWILLAQTP